MATLPKEVQHMHKPLRQKVSNIREELSRPGSAYSNANSRYSKSRPTSSSKSKTDKKKKAEARRESSISNVNVTSDTPNLAFG